MKTTHKDLSARGRITPEALIQWRKLLGWTRRKAAQELQIPFDTFRQYERGKSPIPSVVEVAMNGLIKTNYVG